MTDTKSTPLPTTDSPAQKTNQTVNDVFNKIGVPAAEAAIITAQPWLGWPVICQLWEALFEWIVAQLSAALGVCGAYVVMDAQKYFNLMSAASALADLNKAKASGDQNAINQASQAADAAVAPILRYVGDAHT